MKPSKILISAREDEVIKVATELHVLSKCRYTVGYTEVRITSTCAPHFIVMGDEK